ncbi:MAG: sugar ABC transporter substrate-binding protein [Actinomycetales bacterium]|nr:sugar ABC transporter substrate-binding protein [Tetrasphaera sp.]NLX00300.1 sugar ABC transporter substrate-binding protein [Actinomycetales bacterium]
MKGQHMKARKFAALMAAGALALAACSNGDSSDNGTTDSGDNGAAASDIKIAMVTHGDGGSFWSVAKRGAEDAAEAEGVELDYQESNNDPQQQAQLIEAAVSAGVDGIAVSVPNPDAIKDALQKAADAGIPIVTLNSGSTVYKDFGAITHVGQDEEIAGAGAGEQLAAAGGTKLLCVIHEQNNVGLQSRCAGARSTFGGDVEDFQVTGTADPTQTANEIAAKLQADSSIDAVLALNPDIAMAAVEAVETAGSSANLATFDLSGDVVTAIEDGKILFAVDQQQYLQGYLPVVFLKLYNTNANTVGGGLPVNTGPGFVTKDNAATVASLAQAGTR